MASGISELKTAVPSSAFKAWLDEQRVVIRDAARRGLSRPDELLLPRRLVPDAEDYANQLGSRASSLSVHEMTAFGIPIRVVEDSPSHSV